MKTDVLARAKQDLWLYSEKKKLFKKSEFQTYVKVDFDVNVDKRRKKISMDYSFVIFKIVIKSFLLCFLGKCWINSIVWQNSAKFQDDFLEQFAFFRLNNLLYMAAKHTKLKVWKNLFSLKFLESYLKTLVLTSLLFLIQLLLILRKR